jgi:hypothetical protein
MSSTSNHKKMFHILREAKKNPGLLLAVMFQTMEDNPASVANAYDKVKSGPVQPIREYKCPDCKKTVSALGLGGACGICDPGGMTADIT